MKVEVQALESHQAPQYRGYMRIPDCTHKGVALQHSQVRTQNSDAWTIKQSGDDFIVSPERRQLNFSGANETRSVNKHAKADISSPGECAKPIDFYSLCIIIILFRTVQRFLYVPTTESVLTSSDRSILFQRVSFSSYYCVTYDSCTCSEEITHDEESDQCWITVFGFPPSASSYILDQFSQYGTILHHKACSEIAWCLLLIMSTIFSALVGA